MKVLVVCGSYPPIKCGVGDYANILYSKMAEKVDITVLTSKTVSNDNMRGIKILNVVEKWKGFGLIRFILRLIKKEKYDLVHFQFPTSEYVSNSIAFYVFLPLILRLKRIKVIYTIHEYSDNRWISKVLRKPAIYMSNRIVVVEDRFKFDIFKHNKLINKNKIEVVHIGPNIPHSSLSCEESEELRSLVLENRQNQITRIVSYFGFINLSKRLDVLLNAFAELKKENRLLTLLLIIGEFNSDKCPPEYFKELQRIIDDNHLKENIYVTNFVEAEHVGDYFKISDAAILLFKNGASVRNGSLLAAQQEGLSIITTKPINNLDYFKTEQFKLVENEVDQVKSALLDLQNNPVQKYEAYGMSRWDDIVEQHLKIYLDVLGEKNERHQIKG